MRKAKIISAWEGIYFDEFKKDLSEAAYDWDAISLMTEGKKSKQSLSESIKRHFGDIIN